MTDVHELINRNQDFAVGEYQPDLNINPRGNMMVIGCVDPRVDPSRILGLNQGDAAIIRNVGGRITPATLKTMKMLGHVGAANPVEKRPGIWNLILLHHTDCGMTDLAAFPDLLAEYFVISAEELPGKSVSDPAGSVTVDVGVIRENIRSAAFLVSGMVYDVDSGYVQLVAPPTQLELPV